MHDLFGMIVLWLAVAAEIAIFAFVTAVSVKHCIPWDELRAKKAVRRRLKAGLPALRSRVRGLRSRASDPLRRYRGAWARDLSADITRNAARLLGLVSASVDAVESGIEHHPHEAARIERDVSATLSSIEKMLALRDARLPALERERAAFAKEMLSRASSLRGGVEERARECAGRGVSLVQELRAIALLANAFDAFGAVADDDPGRIFDLFPKWLDLLRRIAESVEIRSAVADRIAEISEEMPVRVAHARKMLVGAQPLLAVLRADPALRSAGRLAALTAAGAVIESAENRLLAARTLASEEGTDLGADGVSTRRLKEALLMAERAAASLVILEEDLTVAVAAFGLGGSSRSN